MKNVTINREQRLYCIRETYGYSCLGFDVCESRTNALAKELEQRGYVVGTRKRKGTLKHYYRLRHLQELAFRDHVNTGWRSESELTPELIGHEGQRVEVKSQWPSGAVETVRFKVGKSTGHIPCHLMLHNSRSSGGCAVCVGKILSVRVIRP